MFKEIIDILQSSRKIVFVLTIGTLLVIIQDTYYNIFPVESSLKTITFIVLICGILYFLWDLSIAFHNWYLEAKSRRITKDEHQLLRLFWESPEEILYLKKESVSSSELSNLRIVLSDLMEKGLICGGYDDSYFLSSKGRLVIKEKLRK